MAKPRRVRRTSKEIPAGFSRCRNWPCTRADTSTRPILVGHTVLHPRPPFNLVLLGLGFAQFSQPPPILRIISSNASIASSTIGLAISCAVSNCRGTAQSLLVLRARSAGSPPLPSSRSTGSNATLQTPIVIAKVSSNSTVSPRASVGASFRTNSSSCFFMGVLS